MATQNTATPSGFLGQTLHFALQITVPAGATFDDTKISVTTNAPGAVVTLNNDAAAVTGTSYYQQTGIVSSPNAAGTYQVSANVTVNGTVTDDQDVAVTWQPLPVESVVFDPAGFSFA